MLPTATIILLALFATAAEAKVQPRDQSPKAKACRAELNEKAPAVWEPIPGKPSNYHHVTNQNERRALYKECMKRP
jgi:hypothetical protein